MPRNAEASAKAERDRLRDRMRGLGCSVPQIAVEMARRFNMRPRLAWRHALDWPQWKLAQRYNTAHPGAKLSDGRVSEFESWPHGGSRPSLRYLARLAATYGHGCTPAQLVDADDLEHLNPSDRCLLTTTPAAILAEGTEFSTHATSNGRHTKTTTLPADRSTGELEVPADLAAWAAAMGLLKPGDLALLLITCLGSPGPFDCDALTTPAERDRTYHQLVQFLTSWAHTMKRRVMLRTLGWAATAASVGYSLNLDEQARVGAVLSNTARIDAQTVEHIRAVLSYCERQDDILGPRGVRDTVLAQRELLRSLLPDCPASLRPRLLSVLSDASRQAGWLSFDLKDFTNAEYFYEDARAFAHDARNVGLGTVILCQMSHMATWRDNPRIGIDHAVAAGQWASRTDDMRLRSYCAGMAAKAYSKDRQRDACLTALDSAEEALASADNQQSEFIYFYGSGAHTLNCGQCHLKLGDTERAIGYAQQSHATLEPSFTRLVAFTSVNLGRAYVQSNEVDEAARLFGDVVEIASQNSSVRLIEVLKQGRKDLQPWAHTAAVRALDDRLSAHGLIVSNFV